MVTFKRELALWRETDVTQRALMIRDDADTYWLACQMQHARIMTPDPDLISDPRSSWVWDKIVGSKINLPDWRVQRLASGCAVVARSVPSVRWLAGIAG